MSEPLRVKNQSLIIASLFLLAISIRAVFSFIVTPDMEGFLIPWYDTIIRYGRDDALSMNFYNYMPPYIYLLDFMTLFRGIDKVVAIKLISIIFDFSAAFALFKIIEMKFPDSLIRWLGFFGLLFLPTVVVDGAFWGQCDIIYCSFLMWALYFILKGKSFWAIFAFSIALSFKLQAIFFAPLFILLLFQKRFKFYWFFIIPVILFISITPAWLFGRSLPDLLTIFYSQMDQYHSLSMRAPNLYAFISNNNFETKVIIGLVIACVLLVVYGAIRIQNKNKWKPQAAIYDAAFLTVLVPFILPKMHERYFFAGCIFLLILALFDADFFVPTILAQASSLLSYIPYLTGWSNTWIKLAAMINLIVIVWLVLPLIKKSIGDSMNHDLQVVITEGDLILLSENHT